MESEDIKKITNINTKILENHFNNILRMIHTIGNDTTQANNNIYNLNELKLNNKVVFNTLENIFNETTHNFNAEYGKILQVTKEFIENIINAFQQCSDNNNVSEVNNNKLETTTNLINNMKNVLSETQPKSSSVFPDIINYHLFDLRHLGLPFPSEHSMFFKNISIHDLLNSLEKNDVKIKRILQNLTYFNAFCERLPIYTELKEINKQYYFKLIDKLIPFSVMPSLLSATDLFSISIEQAYDFYNYLSVKPMLGLNHPVGKSIFKKLDSKVCNSLSGVTLFRGRICEDNRKIDYCLKEMLEPPYGTSSIGRANMPGIPVTYFTDHKEAPIKECRWTPQSNLLYVIEVYLKKSITILDLTLESPLTEYCFCEKSTNNALLEYAIPNFLADCCKEKGIESMALKSTLYLGAINYIFLKCDQDWFTKPKMHKWNGKWL